MRTITYMDKKINTFHQFFKLAVLVVLGFFIGSIVLSSFPIKDTAQVTIFFTDNEEAPESEDDTEDTSNARQPFSEEEKLLHEEKTKFTIKYLSVIHNKDFFNHFTAPQLKLSTPPPEHI